MSDLVIESVDKKAKKTPARKKQKKWVGVDTPIEDMIQWVQDGYTVIFEDDADKFLELPAEVLSTFDRVTLQRYRASEAIAKGVDVIGNATQAALGYDPKAYNVRPGSAEDNLRVFGQKPGMDYRWVRPDKMAKHTMDGYTVDHDANVKTRFNDAGAAKVVGGQQKEELVLMSRPKEVATEMQNRNRAKRERYFTNNHEKLQETFNQAGVKTFTD